MSNAEESESKRENLQFHVKMVTRSWDMMKKNLGLFREEIAETYFSNNPLRKQLFSAPKFGELPSEDALQKRFFKHSTAVINCLETLVDFINGNEETKPILYVLGKRHRLSNVNEKMFLEMKDAVCSVVKSHMDAEMSKAWGVVLEYVFLNYVFPGMYMIETLC